MLWFRFALVLPPLPARGPPACLPALPSTHPPTPTYYRGATSFTIGGIKTRTVGARTKTKYKKKQKKTVPKPGWPDFSGAGPLPLRVSRRRELRGLRAEPAAAPAVGLLPECGERGDRAAPAASAGL